MNAKQNNIARVLTDRVCYLYKHDGNWTFKTEQLDSGEIMISGSNNNDLRWFEKSYLLLAFIGPRGGLKFSPVSDIKAL